MSHSSTDTPMDMGIARCIWKQDVFLVHLWTPRAQLGANQTAGIQ